MMTDVLSILSALASQGKEAATREADIRGKIYGNLLMHKWEDLTPDQRMTLWNEGIRIPKATGFLKWETVPLQADPRLFEDQVSPLARFNQVLEGLRSRAPEYFGGKVHPATSFYTASVLFGRPVSEDVYRHIAHQVGAPEPPPRIHSLPAETYGMSPEEAQRYLREKDALARAQVRLQIENLQAAQKEREERQRVRFLEEEMKRHEAILDDYARQFTMYGKVAENPEALPEERDAARRAMKELSERIAATREQWNRAYALRREVLGEKIPTVQDVLTRPRSAPSHVPIPAPAGRGEDDLERLYNTRIK